MSAQSPETPGFLYNTVMENDQVVLKTICKRNAENGTYVNHIRYAYSYQENGMLESRTMYNWNPESKSWKLTSRMSYSYDSLLNTTTIEYAFWNPELKLFDAPVSKAVYQSGYDDLVTSYTLYEKDKTSEYWSIVGHFDRDAITMASLADR